ncbi:hypothetical protein [Labilithrix luteola]|nr:hypothetical protein [Labilithrix luteola]
MDDATAFERFLTLAKRELSAEDVRLLEKGEEPPEAPNVVVARLPDGRHVVATFAEAPNERDVLSRRLTLLANTFVDALGSPPSERTRARPPVVSSLHEELRALSLRARATDVVVIDVDSPVIWGCAAVRMRPRATTDTFLREVSDRELAAQDESSGPLPDESGMLEAGQDTGLGDLEDASDPRVSRIAPDESRPLLTSEEDDLEEPELTRRAIAAIRRLPALDNLHKGRHLRHVEREGSCYLVLSFSGIYLLALVFDGEFDELRAERAAQESMARIERLVLALPPLDPEPQPMGGVIAFRRARRR